VSINYHIPVTSKQFLIWREIILSLNEVLATIKLLLKRGADPSLSVLPYPALCFAVAAGDLKIVRLLLEKGANPNMRMPKKVRNKTFFNKLIVFLISFVLYTK
jgi:ankyrin repeat protein